MTASFPELTGIALRPQPLFPPFRVGAPGAPAIGGKAEIRLAGSDLSAQEDEQGKGEVVAERA